METLDILCLPFLEALLDDAVFPISIPKYGSASTVCDIADCEDAEDDGEEDDGQTGYIRRSFTDLDTCRGYAQILAVAAFVAELKASGDDGQSKTVSLRDVYYTLKDLFKNQSECNSCVLHVGRILRLKRHEMNIVPAAKGFLSGALKFRFLRISDHQFTNSPLFGEWTTITGTATSSSSSSSSSSSPPSSYLPSSALFCPIGADWVSTPVDRIEVEWCGGSQGRMGGSVSQQQPRWLLVIEKEGVFHRLVEDGFAQRMNCLLVTGCGYPDIATRALVCKLSQLFPMAEVVGVCDYNPDGLALLLTYRFPSMASRFENRGLQSPLRWLGLRSFHVRSFMEKSQQQNNQQTNSTHTAGIGGSSSRSDFEREHLQVLSTTDKRKIQSLLRSNAVQALLPSSYERELESMYSGNCKCEIESCYSFGFSFLPNFLERCLLSNDVL